MRSTARANREGHTVKPLEECVYDKRPRTGYAQRCDGQSRGEFVLPSFQWSFAAAPEFNIMGGNLFAHGGQCQLQVGERAERIIGRGIAAYVNGGQAFDFLEPSLLQRIPQLMDGLNFARHGLFPLSRSNQKRLST